MADQHQETPPAPAPASLSAPRADGLERFYDVCIVGTGLVEAMLSAALAKVGKSVLHLEKRDYYGGEDCASFHFKDLQAWAEAHRQQARPPPPQDKQQQHSNDVPGAPASTPAALRVQWPRARWRNAAGKGSTADDKEKGDQAMQWDRACPKEVTLQPLLPASHLTVRVLRVDPGAAAAAPPPPPPLPNDASADVAGTKKTAAAASAAAEENEKEEGGLEGQQPPWTAERLGACSRDFNLDLCPLVLLAGSDAISPLLSSGVASYLEFRTLQALFIATTSISSSSTSGGGASETPVAFHRVPCSKTDVFASTLLPAKEKRQLMRFLQCAADWGFAQQSGQQRAVMRRNEAELGQGRSLHRPQNKAVGDLDVQAFASRPFLAFLRDGAKMDAHLQGVILHALALAPSSSTASSSSPALTTEAGLARVCAHLRGLGQYGHTAFLWPIFGAADVTQAFCRTASVWGATFLLRAQPRGLWVTPDGRRCLGVRLPDDDGGDGEGGAIACDHVILGQAALPGCMPTGQRALRRLVILDGPPPALLRVFQATTAAAASEGLSGGVIPAGVLPGEGGATMHFYCVDPTARCSPVGVYLLHLAATLESGGGGDEENEDDARALALMDAATAALLKTEQQPENGKGEGDVSVLWSVTYEDPILRPPPPPSSLPGNVLFVRKMAPEFYLQAALDQARELFAALCPGEPFLPAEVPEGVLPFDFLRGSQGEGDRDQEEEILEATVSVFQQPPPPPAGEAGGNDVHETPREPYF